MKNILLSCLLSIGLFTCTHAYAGPVPDTLRFDIPTTSYEGGSSYAVRINAIDDKRPGDNLRYDIGVSKQIIQGRITQFKVMSSVTVDASAVASQNYVYNLQIPNPLNQKPGDTYVAYIKSYYPNDPDSEHLVITKPFSIKGNTKPALALEGAALLMNTGQAVNLTAGPTIYKIAKSKDYATSTSLVLALNTNTTFSVTPKITFTKLRSDNFKQEIVGDKIAIKAGGNSVIIPLPTFDYEPGVYMGKLALQPDNIQVDTIKEIEFQYIVDGPFVTVGSLDFISQQDQNFVFNLQTFGNPTDRLTPGADTGSSTEASSTQVYKTEITFLDEKNEVLTIVSSTNDYSKSPYIFEVARGLLKKAVSAEIKVYDSDNKIFFQTSRNVLLPQPVRSIDQALYALVILLLGIGWYLISRKKRILVLTVLLAVVFATSYVFAENWTPSPNQSQFYDANHTVYLTFNKNYSTDSISCSEGVDVLVKLRVVTCTNTTDQVKLGMSRISMSDAENASVSIDYQNGYGVPGIVLPGKTHVFSYDLPFIKIGTIQGPIAAGSKMYVYAEMETDFGRWTHTGYSKYEIPLVTTPATGVGSCDKCDNITGQQDVPAFTARGRSYFLTNNNGDLHFAPSSATLPGSCTLDMCADTDTNESQIPVGYMWDNTKPTAYERASCVPIPVGTCSCNGRNKVCVQNGVVTSDAPDSSCNLDAACTYPLFNPSGSVTFTYSATNVLGTLIGGGSFATTVPATGAGTVTETRTLSNTGDGQTDTATCSYAYDNNPGGGGGGTGGGGNCSDPGFVGPCEDPNNNPSITPTITSFTASKIVDKGGQCVFSWETDDFLSCSINGELVGLSGSISYGTEEGRNIIKTLTCSRNGQSVQSKTATCLVRPTVIQE